MSVFSRGDQPIVETNSGNKFWRPDAKALLNRAFVLTPSLNGVLVAPKHGVFKVSGGPCNASWIDIGAQDVGNLLGLKPSQKAFVWVLVPNNPANKSAGYTPLMWECSKTHFGSIATQVQEFGSDLQGLMVVMKKDGNRWNMSANVAPKTHAVDPAILAEEWQKVVDLGLGAKSDDDASEAWVANLGKMVGLIETQELQKKFLVERCQKEDPKVVNWAGVLRKFGLDGGATTEAGDIEEV